MAKHIASYVSVRDLRSQLPYLERWAAALVTLSKSSNRT